MRTDIERTTEFARDVEAISHTYIETCIDLLHPQFRGVNTTGSVAYRGLVGACVAEVAEIMAIVQLNPVVPMGELLIWKLKRSQTDQNYMARVGRYARRWVVMASRCRQAVRSFKGLSPNQD